MTAQGQTQGVRGGGVDVSCFGFSPISIMILSSYTYWLGGLGVGGCRRFGHFSRTEIMLRRITLLWVEFLTGQRPKYLVHLTSVRSWRARLLIGRSKTWRGGAVAR